jgi:hypothetical protein
MVGKESVSSSRHVVGTFLRGPFVSGRLFLWHLSTWAPLLVRTFKNEWASQEAGYLTTTVHNVQVEQPVVVVNHTQSLSAR